MLDITLPLIIHHTIDKQTTLLWSGGGVNTCRNPWPFQNIWLQMAPQQYAARARFPWLLGELV